MNRQTNQQMDHWRGVPPAYLASWTHKKMK